MKWAKTLVSSFMFQFCHISNSRTVRLPVQRVQTKRKCRNEFEFLSIAFTNSLSSKTFIKLFFFFFLFSGTPLSTSRFISFSVTKANRSPYLDIILIANLKHPLFENWGIINNYSLKWRWIVMAIYLASREAARFYPSLSPTPRWAIVLVYTTQAE